MERDYRVRIYGTMALFALAGSYGAFTSGGPSALPHALFYAVLLLNTYQSIRLFAHIEPRDILQAIFNAVLVALYCALALSIGEPIRFPLLSLAVFVAATPKYWFMLGKIGHDAYLWRKIRIDLSGVALTALSALLAVAGFPLSAAWLLALVFACANIYHLWLRPMYVIPEGE